MTIETLKQYLSSNLITPEGYLDEDIKNNNLDALFYVIYTIEKYSCNKKLKKKIKLLAQRIGRQDSDNDIRRNYENILVEFHALYILTGKMKYNFLDFDIPSNKQYVRKNSNCDILIEKDGRQYLVDVKQSSTQLMSESLSPKFNLIDINEPLIPEVLEKYIKRLIREAEEQGCDFLVLQIPKWDLPNLDMGTLSNFLKKISKDITYQEGKWVWPIKDTHITKLIFPKGLEFFEIEVIPS